MHNIMQLHSYIKSIHSSVPPRYQQVEGGKKNYKYLKKNLKIGK